MSDNTKVNKYKQDLSRLSNSASKTTNPSAVLASESSQSQESDSILRLNLNERDYVLNYANDLEIHEDELNLHLSKQPGLYAFYGRIVALQKSVVDRLKLEIKEYEGRLFLGTKAKLLTISERKAPTISEVEAYMCGDARLKNFRRELITEQLQLDILNVIKDSFAQRKDTLVALAANKRREWDTELFVNKLHKFEKSRKSGE